MTAGKPSSTDSMLPRDGESVGRCGGCLGRAGALWAGPGALLLRMATKKATKNSLPSVLNIW